MDRLAQTTKADDGRVLMFAEYGPADGLPVLSFHGTPQCRLRVERTVAVVTDLGIRLISYDWPGCGGSDRMAGRMVADSAGDARAILDAVGVERAAVHGGSGGTPPGPPRKSLRRAQGRGRRHRGLSPTRRPRADVMTVLRYVTSVVAAEGEGFEPPSPWRGLRFSRPLRSTAPASLRGSTQCATAAGGTAAGSLSQARAKHLELVGVLLQVADEELLEYLRHRHHTERGMHPGGVPLLRCEAGDEDPKLRDVVPRVAPQHRHRLTAVALDRPDPLRISLGAPEADGLRRQAALPGSAATAQSSRG